MFSSLQSTILKRATWNANAKKTTSSLLLLLLQNTKPAPWTTNSITCRCRRAFASSHGRPSTTGDKDTTTSGTSSLLTETNNTHTQTHHHQTNPNRIIYARNPKRRFFARALLGSSTVHMAYWAWYVLDFTPAVNASNIEMIQMDPTVGYVGWTLSVIMLGGASLYPKYLIGEISVSHAKTKNDKIIKCHTFPLVNLETVGTHVDGNITKIRMDTEDNKRKQLVDEGKLPIGHVAVEMEGMRGNFLLDVKEDQGEVVDKIDLVAFLMGWRTTATEIVSKNLQTKKTKGNNAVDSKRRLRAQQRALRRRGRF